MPNRRTQSVTCKGFRRFDYFPDKDEVPGSNPGRPTDEKPLPRSGNVYAARALDLRATGPVVSWDSLRYVRIRGSHGQFTDSPADSASPRPTPRLAASGSLEIELF